MLSVHPVEKGQVNGGEQAVGGGKAHLAGKRGRKAAAWRSSLGCPSWSPLLAPLAEPGRVLQTGDLVLEVAVTDAHQIYRVVAYTLKKEHHEVESLTVQSTGLEEEVVSSLGNPSCDQEYEAGERVLVP